MRISFFWSFSLVIFGLNTFPLLAQDADKDVLRSQIHSALKFGHSRISYSQAYIELGDIFEDPNNEDNVILFYTNRSQPKSLRVSQDHHDGWNREHLWPQSRGAERKPVRSDLHHLRPTDATVNSRRGNLDFDNGGSPEGEAPATFRDRDSFEPRDEIKGDVARSMFYVDVRYEGTGSEPDLVLVDARTGRGTTVGDLCTLLEWHQNDPPDDEERRVNERIEEIQGNRNLFVDQPELAVALFGDACDIDGLPGKGVASMSVSIAPTALPSTTPVPDLEFRIATFNIENFWHVEGEHLRPAKGGGPGSKRSVDDYDAIRAIIDKLEADIIGLQEFGAPDGVRLLFPEQDWDMVFSKRFEDDLIHDPTQIETDTKRDIYTALVVRRSAAKIVGTERIELDDLGAGRTRLREGTAALIDVAGQRFWAASIHLKSGCFETNNLGSDGSCRTLAKQIPILEDWLDAKSLAGERVALLGDFNRQLDRGIDVIRQDLDDNDPVDIFKVPHRQKSLCEAFKPTPRVSIDYVLLNEAMWEFVSVPAEPKLNFSDRQISDHCPVFVDVDFDQ